MTHFDDALNKILEAFELRVKREDFTNNATWEAKEALKQAIDQYIIGDKEYYHSHYPFVRTEKQWLQGKEEIARDELRNEQRQALFSKDKK